MVVQWKNDPLASYKIHNNSIVLSIFSFIEF